jgi:hypothetical protein
MSETVGKNQRVERGKEERRREERESEERGKRKRGKRGKLKVERGELKESPKRKRKRPDVKQQPHDFAVPFGDHGSGFESKVGGKEV